MDAGGFLMGVIMAQCHGIILRFKAMAPGAQQEHPAAQTFLERCEAKALLEASEVIGSVEQGDGMLLPRWCQGENTVGRATASK